MTNGAVDPQAALRAELAQLKGRVAELESQLGVRKNRGLKFTVSNFFYIRLQSKHWSQIVVSTSKGKTLCLVWSGFKQ